MRDTPYDRCRTLTAAYRAGACLSLDDFPAVSSQRLLQNFFFLICAELISARFLFLRYRGGGKCRDKIISKNAGRIFLRFGFIRSFLRLQYCSILVATRFSGGAF